VTKQTIFLGGTVGNNNWREGFIKTLGERGISQASFFNPVVEHWDREAQQNEEVAKEKASHLVFFITDPKKEGHPLFGYSLSEAVMALYDKPDRTVVVFDTRAIAGHALKEMNQTIRVLKKRFSKANIFEKLEDAGDWLAGQISQS